MKKYSRTLIFSIGLMAIAGIAWAAGEQTLSFQPGPDAKKDAKAQAVVSDVGADQKQVTIMASGLQPNSVYTVWFVNEQPKMDMAGVGKGDYSFRTDSRGSGTYTATVPASDLEKWQMFKIALHPDGNARNMDNIKIALQAEIDRLG